MPINRALLDERIDYITTHPEEHHQDTWAVRREDEDGVETLEWVETFQDDPGPACGTAFCLAGHVVNTIPGVKFIWESLGGASMIILPGEPWSYIDSQAQKMLGLNSDQAAALFHAYNTLDDIRRLRDEFYAAEDAGIEWEWV